MKKNLLVVSLMFVLVFAFGGCATKGDLEQIQAQETATSAKADQAAKDALDAKTAADEAIKRAEEAAARAENAVKMAEAREQAAAEREKAAADREKEAEAMFQQSMRK